MALNKNNSAIFFLLALLLLTSLNPLAHAITANLSSIALTGRLCCTSTGNCIVGGRGIANVTVRVNCTNTAGGVVTVGEGPTNIDGVFTGNFANLIGINALMPCTASVQLPLPATTCPELSTQVVGNTQLLGNKGLLGRSAILGVNSQLVGNVGVLSAQVNVVRGADGGLLGLGLLGGGGLLGQTAILGVNSVAVRNATIGVLLRT